MVIGIMGENCSGKSTLAEAIQKTIGAQIITGKDYLRLAKSESEAERLFREKLKDAMTGENVIYVISEKEYMNFFPEGAIRIHVKADMDTIKARFKERMHGNLPVPVERMLERKHGMFDNETYDYQFDGQAGDFSPICSAIRARVV